MSLRGMGFEGLGGSGVKRSKPSGAVKYTKDMLHRAECNACPLNNIVGTKHPNMPASGSEKPVIYMLGEAPGQDEDATGKQFVGKSGRLLRKHIPEEWSKRLRWNNVVRTRPPKNRTPEYLEIECCRPSIIRDIERTKPKAIFGFGGVPLTWATGLSGISFWSGRHMPVKIGNHVCWFFPMFHPSYILRRGAERGGADGYTSEEEFAFEIQLKRAFKMVDKLPEARVHSKEEALAGVRVIDGSKGNTDVAAIVKALQRAAKAKIAGLDYETNCVRPYLDGSKILTAAISTEKDTFTFPLRHKQSPWTPKQLQTVEDAFSEFLEESKCLKVVHNLPFELEWSLKKFGRGSIENGRWGCSQSQAYIIDERIGAGVQSLDGLCVQYFGISIKSLNVVNRANLDNTPMEQVLPYNGVDAKYHRMLFEAQMPRIVKDDLQDQYYHNVARMAGLVQMQAKGVPVSKKRAENLHRKYSKKIAVLDSEIEKLPSVVKFKRMYQRPFKPGSNDDVLKLLTNVLKLKLGKVDIEHIKGKGVETDKILERRKYAKLDSTYILPALPGSPILFNGRFHPIVSTVTTRTWRTSSEAPNSQNWPKYGEAKVARTLVRPGRGQVVVAFDFAGIQARNVAMESGDKNLVKYYWERYDIHTDWMERVIRLYPRWVKEGVKKLVHDKELRKHYRQQSKNKFVFPAFFGAGAKTTSSGLEVPEEIGFKLGQEFKEEFPGIAKWHKEVRARYRKTGYVTGLSGFRRRAPVAATEQINTPIQSDESVIVLDALIRLTELGDERLIPNLEIHDDLTFIWYKEEVDELAPIVIRTMLDCSYEWTRVVPLEVEMSIGEDWAKLEGVGAYASDTWDRETLVSAH